MRQFKRFTAISMAILTILSNSTFTYASNMENNSSLRYSIDVINPITQTLSTDIEFLGSNDYKTPDNLKNIGKISVNQDLVINDTAIALYPTFEDQSSALQNISKTCQNILTEFINTYQSKPLSDENYKTYQEFVNNYERSNLSQEMKNELVTLDVFLDIYENQFQNDEIIETAKSVSSIEKLLKDTDFNLLLPYTVSRAAFTTLANSINLPLDEPQTKAFTYNRSAAINYAKNHADSNNINKSEYGYIEKADCTNFASQILEAGGMKRNTKWNFTKLPVIGFHYTDAWANANAFVNYFGVNQTFTKHSSFSSHVISGSFITEDKANDSDWDHMGFVTDISGYNSTLKFYDYQVAQHTSDYLAWASSSKCGWDTLPEDYPNIIYGIMNF